MAGKRFNRRQVFIAGIGAAAATAAVALVDGQVAETSTRNGRSLHVVAHADDTLVFMNPDEQGDIARGDPVRAVFLTAGNVNQLGTSYWESREAGVLAAFAQMAGVANAWSGRTLTINGHALDLRTLSANRNLSVLFMRLPDGGPNGSGFPVSNDESLQSLWTGAIPTMHAIDGSTSYTKQGLISTLARLIARFQPVTIRTQDFVHTFGSGDHSDHYATALFTRAARKACGSVEPALVGYLGYPTGGRPANLSGDQLKDKIHTYFVYAPHDLVAPQTLAAANKGAYGNWLARRYTVATINSGVTARSLSPAD